MVAASSLSRTCLGGLALLAFAFGASAAPACAQQKITIVHQTWVTLELTLVLQDSAGRTSETHETLRGRAGERLAFAAPLPSSNGPMMVGLVVSPRPDRVGNHLWLRLEADVRPARQRPTTTARTLTITPGRTGLAELWRDASSRASLVAAIGGSWEEVPTLSQILPGAEPIDLVVEVVARDSGGEYLLEQHRLGSLVGSTSRYALGFNDGSGAPKESVSVELTSRRIEAGKLLLGARLLRDGAETPVATIDELALASGFSFDMAMKAEEGREIVVRITPFF